MALRSCCGCFSLKTGTIMMGVLSMISSVIVFVLTIVAICGLEQNSNVRFENPDRYIPVKAMIISAIIYIAILFSFALMLVLGAKNRKANLVFPYLCLDFASLTASIAIAVGFFSFLIISPDSPISLALVIMLLLTSFLALKTYLWMVIYHFYQELLAEKFGHKINPATGKILREPFEQDV